MGTLGNWFFPNKSGVGIGKTNNIYKNRGPSVVRLHHKQNDISSPSGIYRCDIPDDSVNQSIFVGVYPMEQGENVMRCVKIHS